MPDDSFSLRLVRLTTGAYHPVLVDRGRPLVLPNLWADDLALTTRFNTVRAYLGDVLQFYRWARKTNINPYEVFASLRGFSPALLKSMVVYMTTRSDGGRAAQSSCDRKCAAIRSYFSFCHDYFISKRALTLLEQRQAESNRNANLKRIAKLFVMRAQHGETTFNTEELREEELDQIEGKINPASTINPFHSNAIRVRNYCIWRLMLATGARRSEIVLLELDDLTYGKRPTVTFRYPTVLAAGRRRDGASLKTRPRTLPINESLASLLETYVEDWRSTLVKPRHPSAALFLSARDGRRMSSGTLNTIFSVIGRGDEGGVQRKVHPHRLRTTAMNALSRRARDPDGRVSPDFRDHLTYYAGWSPSSDMPLTYTREAISEVLGRLIRKTEKKS